MKSYTDAVEMVIAELNKKPKEVRDLTRDLFIPMRDFLVDVQKMADPQRSIEISNMITSLSRIIKGS